MFKSNVTTFKTKMQCISMNYCCYWNYNSKPLLGGLLVNVENNIKMTIVAMTERADQRLNGKVDKAHHGPANSLSI